LTFNVLYGVIAQKRKKIELFIPTAVRTSYPTQGDCPKNRGKIIGKYGFTEPEPCTVFSHVIQ
jgi:hypothetical protein